MGLKDWLIEKKRKADEERAEYNAAYREELKLQSTKRRAEERVAMFEKARREAALDSNHGGRVGRRAAQLFEFGSKTGATVLKGAATYAKKPRTAAVTRRPVRRAAKPALRERPVKKRPVRRERDDEYSLGVGGQGGLSLAVGGKKKRKGMPFI